MTFFAKSVIALFFLASGIIAILCMMALMGRAERKLSATFLRRTHKTAGAVFFLLLLFLSYYCLRYVALAGGELSSRAVFHGVLALALFIVLLLKVLIVQFYKEYMRLVPTLGMIVFCLAFLVFSTSAGYFFLRAGRMKAHAGETAARAERVEAQFPSEEGAGEEAVTIAAGDAGGGASYFEQNCGFCHHADRVDSKLGPGLKGILGRDALPHSGRPATEENVRSQLMNPVGTMPSFESISNRELADLMAFLRTI